MIIVKLLVISVLFVVVFANSSDYCKICPNHTLCVYPIAGPGPACSGYDASAQLTRDDIINIVNRVNERRNFVALGLSKLLPTAANMRKMSWSEDLAWSAQRWVDQCDPAVQPDRHDICRNLEDIFVGQNIATIFGPSPGLSVKSFVDIWFMQTLEYSGRVSFYNESRDADTRYLTQLIWAETDSIGCGRARFYIEYTVVERLVCNFAPSGNVHGRPVYTMGVPATQCPANWRPDDTYSGLCKLEYISSMYSHQNPLASSLLRIVNSTNNSVKQETDSSGGDFKPLNVDADENDDHRHQKSRHVVNNSQGELSQPLQFPMLWNNLNDSRNLLMHQYQPNTQPRLYHGHHQKENLIPPYTASNQQNFRRYDICRRIPNATWICGRVYTYIHMYKRLHES
ncbi:cysteine-rich secretory protein family domain-containing protein [Phthorimaea operculella]|nr:cysteine-rich secretory protein family domain-containing protein [Phthorimaea operculella]